MPLENKSEAQEESQVELIDMTKSELVDMVQQLVKKEHEKLNPINAVDQMTPRERKAWFESETRRLKAASISCPFCGSCSGVRLFDLEKYQAHQKEPELKSNLMEIDELCELTLVLHCCPDSAKSYSEERLKRTLLKSSCSLGGLES